MYPKAPDSRGTKSKKSHKGNTEATEVTAKSQKLPKGIYPKVNTYAKNTVTTAAEENNVFKMLNDSPDLILYMHAAWFPW